MNRQTEPDVDVVVVGAGMAGLYLLHRLREMGRSVVCLEAADDVGGTWYWNRYPGARCDIESVDYQYTWDPELDDEWEWSERYATQPEILRYLQHVADKHDLRPMIRFSTRVAGAVWDDDSATWTIRTEGGDTVTCRYYVMATGCLSAPKEIDVPGVDRFTGDTYWTSRFPHDGVDFTGKRVGVIGTGSSGIQSIPIIAEQAAELTVFQRTPNFSLPARNGPNRPDKLAQIEGRRDEYRAEMRESQVGVPRPVHYDSAALATPEERLERFEAGWDEGHLLSLTGSFGDIITDAESNELVCEFVRGKIRETVDDPDVAERLCPTSYPIGTKRVCLDTDYYATFNLPHVRLVDLRDTPISTITETGIDTSEESFELDVIVFATGFDAMTGAIVAVDVQGRDGVTLKDEWADGPRTYLGLTAVGFPNYFMITGPQSPSVLSNMAISIEQHVDWICDALTKLTDDGHEVIEPTPAAQDGWVRHATEFADITLFPQADSWYVGANVPGKPRVVMPYVGGVGRYRRICDEVLDRDLLGFVRRGPDGEVVNDGLVATMQPDVMAMLDVMAELGLPPIDSLSPAEARGMMEQMAAQNPPGPEVGEIVDGTYPGADGELAYRLYRPASPGPHPVVVYFHGGGWVLGHATSDDPLCRDLCVRSDAAIVSMDYRHAPEHPFPAPVDDAVAAVRWVADHADELGVDAERLVVAGWSAGGNLATVAARVARDEGGPAIAGQLLITPVTDSDPSRASYTENGEGKVLTADLMRWFWDHYAPPDQRSDPRAAPIRAASLADLPPAVVFTADFDPLRDEGIAYVEALRAAGTEARHERCRGHIHTSLGAVDALPTSAEPRARMAEAIRGFVGAPVPV